MVVNFMNQTGTKDAQIKPYFCVSLEVFPDVNAIWIGGFIKVSSIRSVLSSKSLKAQN